MKQKHLITILLLLQSITVFAAGPTSRPARPLPEIERVLIVSIDGLRPDIFLRPKAPHLRSLMDAGSFTFWARTTAVSITLPSHVSMLTGVVPVRHGIQWNEDLPFSEPYYPKVPTIFELAHKTGYSTAMVAAKPKFAQIPKPGMLDWVFVPTPGGKEKGKKANKPADKQASGKNLSGDAEVADNALQILREHKPDLLFVHFGSTDVVGHGKGWGSPEQLAALEQIDAYIGQFLEAYKTLGLFEHTAIIVNADHGGQGTSHGADDVRSRTIPWMISGPGIRKNYDLTREPELEVNIYDTFATTCYLLGIPLPGKTDGKPILQAIEANSPK